MPQKTIPFIAYHPDYVLHLPEKHRVPIDKFGLLPQQLLHEGVVTESDFFEPGPADKKLLEPVHEKSYLEKALGGRLTKKEITRLGYPYDDHLIRRELRIVQGTVTGAEIALQEGIAFNVAGGTHHAGSNWGEGFCLFNDVATAALYLQEKHKVRKILIIDLDVHQGNGTAEILKKHLNIFTFSIHGQNNFPFEKEISDLDIGLKDNTEGKEYLSVLEQNMEKLFRTQHPEFVFYLAGADVLWNDKMGRLKLTKEDCRQRDRMVFEYCRQYQTPVQVGTAGGYSIRLADILDVHCQTFKEGIAIMKY